MMSFIKKKILTIGTLTSVIAPLTFILSCGTTPHEQFVYSKKQSHNQNFDISMDSTDSITTFESLQNISLSFVNKYKMLNTHLLQDIKNSYDKSMGLLVMDTPENLHKKKQILLNCAYDMGIIKKTFSLSFPGGGDILVAHNEIDISTLISTNALVKAKNLIQLKILETKFWKNLNLLMWQQMADIFKIIIQSNDSQQYSESFKIRANTLQNISNNNFNKIWISYENPITHLGAVNISLDSTNEDLANFVVYKETQYNQLLDQILTNSSE